MSENVYLGNPNLKRANVQQEWTKEEVEEYARCMKDPIYFIVKSIFCCHPITRLPIGGSRKIYVIVN